MVIFSGISSAQDYDDYNEMLENAEMILYTQPAEAIKIADHILKNSSNSNLLVQANLINVSAYYIKGELEKAVKAGVEAKIISETAENIPLQLKATVTTIPLLNQLGLDVVAKQYYINTIALAEKLNTQESSFFRKGGKALLNAHEEIKQENWQRGLDYFTEAKLSFEEIPDEILVNQTTASMIEIYGKVYNIDSANNEFETVLTDTNGDHPNNFLKMVASNQLGKLLFQKQEYSKSIEAYTVALKISEQFQNKKYQAEISENLSSVYLALKDPTAFYTYKKIAQQLDDKAEKEEDQAVNSIYNYVNNNNTTKSDSLKKMYVRNFWIFSAILGIIILSYILLRFRYRNRANQYNSFISYIANREHPKEIIPTKDISKGVNIPQETENALVNKLEQFENSKQFTKQDMSLALLAANFETNTKYLSEVINTHKGKNFNSYINELRINYIIDKLKSNKTYLQYKISYLAEESGFSSHSSFATVFKAVTGIPPTVFIDLLKSTSKSSKHIYEEAE